MKILFGLIGIVVIVALIVMLTGCTGSAAKDCGSDAQCFIEATQTCTPAKVSMIEGGVGMYMEIKGGTTDSCTIYYEFDLGQLGKYDMTCTVPSIQQIDINNPLALCDYCSGSLMQYYCG